MSERFQVQRLILSRLRPFEFCDLDFTDPHTGEALSQICLIGPNGCGKSTLFHHLYSAFTPPKEEAHTSAPGDQAPTSGLVLIQISTSQGTILRIHAESDPASPHWFSCALLSSDRWPHFLENGMSFEAFLDAFAADALAQEDIPLGAPLPTCYLSPTRDLFQNEPPLPLPELLRSIKHARHERFLAFLTDPAHRDESVGDIESLFQEIDPDPLIEIANTWTPMLQSAHLSFSPEYLEGVTSLATGDSIPFSKLSHAQQRAMTRLAALTSLSHPEKSAASALFLDEPENGLSSELATSLLSDLLHQSPHSGSQVVVATLSDSITSLFSQEETFELAFAEDGAVQIVPPAEEEEEIPPQETAEEPETEKEDKTPTAANRLAHLKREIASTDDQEELANLLDELISMRRR